MPGNTRSPSDVMLNEEQQCASFVLESEDKENFFARIDNFARSKRGVERVPCLTSSLLAPRWDLPLEVRRVPLRAEPVSRAKVMTAHVISYVEPGILSENVPFYRVPGLTAIEEAYTFQEAVPWISCRQRQQQHEDCGLTHDSLFPPLRAARSRFPGKR